MNGCINVNSRNSMDVSVKERCSHRLSVYQ
jgi:hypothetical protein